MNPEIKKLAPIIWQEIERAKKILLHFHVHPDGDSIGSALGLYHALKSVGKDVTVIRGDSEIAPAFKAVPGLDQVLPQNILETDLNQFDLFIILDSGAPDRVTALGPLQFPALLQTIVIDHHASNPGFGRINLILGDYPATAQVVFELLVEWKIGLNEQIATCLFLGLYTDTYGFQYAKTSSATLQAAAVLRGYTPNISRVLFELENNQSREELALDGLALSKIEAHGQVAIALLTYADLEAHHLTGVHIETGHISQRLKSVPHWQIGATIIESRPGYVKVSLRHRDPKQSNLAEILKPLGGGGHVSAAGAIITDATPAEVKDRLLESIKNLYPALLK